MHHYSSPIYALCQTVSAPWRQPESNIYLMKLFYSRFQIWYVFIVFSDCLCIYPLLRFCHHQVVTKLLFFISHLFSFFLILVVFTSFIFRIFVSFTFRTISVLSISHFIFLLNNSVLFSLCARLNWQCVCQFLSANFSLYCIVLYSWLMHSVMR